MYVSYIAHIRFVHVSCTKLKRPINTTSFLRLVVFFMGLKIYKMFAYNRCRRHQMMVASYAAMSIGIANQRSLHYHPCRLPIGRLFHLFAKTSRFSPYIINYQPFKCLKTSCKTSPNTTCNTSCLFPTYTPVRDKKVA